MLQFTEKQANAILEMRLYKLIGLELDALVKEHEETIANIYRYEDILERRDSMATVIIKELDNLKKEYATSRKTVVEDGEEAVFEEKKPEEMEIVVLMDRFGYIRAIDKNTYERNKEAADAEHKFVFLCKNTGRICLFTNRGILYTVKAGDLPFGKFRDKGIPVDNISNYDSSAEDIIYAVSQTALNLYRVIFATKFSMVKVVSGGEFDVSKRTVAATKLQEGDELLDVTVLNGQKDMVFQSVGGFFLKFSLEEIPEKKKGAIGVRGMKLGENDTIEAVYYAYPEGEGENETISYKSRNLDLHKLKSGKRDTKGTKIRA